MSFYLYMKIYCLIGEIVILEEVNFWMFTSTIRPIRISHQNEKFEIFNLEIYLKVSLIKSTDNSDFFFTKILQIFNKCNCTILLTIIWIGKKSDWFFRKN